MKSLQVLKEQLDHCTKCDLFQGNKQSVVYRGNPLTAKLLFIGEAAGYDEDLTGLPFVGKAGQLLQRALDKLSLTEDDYVITNTVMHRPPNNRVPTKAELQACRPHLIEVITTVKPKVIVTLGNTPLNIFYPKDLIPFGKPSMGILTVHGQVWDTSISGVTYKTIALSHPSFIMRTEHTEHGKHWKKRFWEDLNKAWELANG